MPLLHFLDTSLTTQAPPSLPFCLRMGDLSQVIYTVFLSSDILYLQRGAAVPIILSGMKYQNWSAKWSDPEVFPLNSSHFHLLPHLS